MRSPFAALLLLLAGSLVPTVATEVMTYAFDIIGTNLPDGALDKIYDNPGEFFKLFVDTFPGAFFTLPGDPIVDPHPSNRLLRGSEPRELQINTCNRVFYPRLCASASLSTSSDLSSVLTVDAGVRKLYPASIKTSVLKGITKSAIAKVKNGLCAGVSSCKVEVKITQLA